MHILTGQAGFVRADLASKSARDTVNMAKSQDSELDEAIFHPWDQI